MIKNTKIFFYSSSLCHTEGKSVCFKPPCFLVSITKINYGEVEIVCWRAGVIKGSWANYSRLILRTKYDEAVGLDQWFLHGGLGSLEIPSWGSSRGSRRHSDTTSLQGGFTSVFEYITLHTQIFIIICNVFYV